MRKFIKKPTVEEALKLLNSEEKIGQLLPWFDSTATGRGFIRANNEAGTDPFHQHEAAVRSMSFTRRFPQTPVSSSNKETR